MLFRDVTKNTKKKNVKKDGNNNPVYETAKETLIYRTVLWIL